MADLKLFSITIPDENKEFEFDTVIGVKRFVAIKGFRKSSARTVETWVAKLKRGDVPAWVNRIGGRRGRVQFVMRIITHPGNYLLNAGEPLKPNVRKAKYRYPRSRPFAYEGRERILKAGEDVFKTQHSFRSSTVDTSNSQIGTLGFDKFFVDILKRITEREGVMYRIIISFRNMTEEITGADIARVFEPDDLDTDYAVSTHFSTSKIMLLFELHEKYKTLLSMYDDVQILSFTIVARKFTSTLQTKVGFGNLETIRQLIRVMKYKTRYNGKYDAIIKAIDGKGVYVPNSYMNCFMKCYLVSVTDIATKKQLNHDASALKQTWFGDARKTFTLQEYLDKIMEHAPINIAIYDLITMSPIIVRTDKSELWCNLIIIGDHVCAILPDNKRKRWGVGLENPQMQATIMKTIEAKPVRPFTHTFAYDFETLTDENNKCFCVSVYGGKNKECKNFYGVGICVIEFMEWIRNYAEEIPTNKKIIQIEVYAHNGGKFDTHFLFQYVLDNPQCGFSIPSVFTKQGRLMSFTSFVGRYKKIIFRDSFTLFASSLDGLSEDFDIEHKKLTGSVDMKLFSQQHIYKEELKRDIIKYCNYDVMSLYEVLEKFHEILIQEFDIEFRDKTTISSISKLIFLSRYYDPKKFPLYTLSDTIDKIVRKDFYGGRTDIGEQIGVIPLEEGKDGFYYLDYCSHHPTQMSKKPLPYGLPIIKIGDRDCRRMMEEGYLGFIDCMVRSKQIIKIPLHGYKHEVNGVKKLIFPNFKNWTSINIFSEEIKIGINEDLYEYKMEKGVFFKGGMYFKKCIDDIFKLKKDASDSPARKSTFKVLLNSQFGWPGINRYTSTCKVVTNDHMLRKTLACGLLSNVCEFPERKCKLIEYDSYMSKIESNVAISASIASYSRIALWQLMMEVDNHGGKVYYCDTDSIICDLPLEDMDFFKEKYFSHPNEMGDLANEITKVTKNRDHFDHTHRCSPYLTTIAPKFYEVLGYQKMKGFAVRGGMIVLNKDKKKIYVMQCDKKLENGKKNELYMKKAKLTHEHYQLIAQGWTVVQKNALVFSGSMSKQYFQSKGREIMQIPVSQVIKKFRMQYDKQTIGENNKLTPLLI